MEDEYNTENTEPGSESDTEAAENEIGQQTILVESTDYTEQLQLMYECQQIGIGLCCVIIGLILVDIIFNVLKRFF